MYIRRRMKKRQCSLFVMIFYFLLEQQQRILHLIEPVVSRKRCNHDVSYIANNNVVCTEDSIETEEEETSRSTRGPCNLGVPSPGCTRFKNEHAGTRELPPYRRVEISSSRFVRDIHRDTGRFERCLKNDSTLSFD